jgi:Swt1-like HEPN
MLEPTEALESTENALRLIIRLRLGNSWTSALTQERLDSFERRREEECLRRDGVAMSADLLMYTDFTDITTIIMKEWPTFKPVFDDQARTKAYFSLFEDVRNAIAHSRPLVPFEQELLSGMATQLRNQIGLYRMSENPKSQHYPLIESAVDSFGTESYTYTRRLVPQGGGRTRLEAGDRIEITCRSVDPRGRKLEWLLGRTLVYDDGSFTIVELSEPSAGDTVKLACVVREGDVGENFRIVVFLRSTGRFHLRSDQLYAIEGMQGKFEYDDIRYFTYAVNPPAD